jgi:hypothetical protein
MSNPIYRKEKSPPIIVLLNQKVHSSSRDLVSGFDIISPCLFCGGEVRLVLCYVLTFLSTPCLRRLT